MVVFAHQWLIIVHCYICIMSLRSVPDWVTVLYNKREE